MWNSLATASLKLEASATNHAAVVNADGSEFAATTFMTQGRQFWTRICP